VPVPQPAPNDQTYNSPDGTRQVIVSGDSQVAYLYDISGAQAFNPVYLGSGVIDVQFQSDDSGTVIGITTYLDDGAYNLFDQNGQPQAEVVFSPDRTRKVEVSGSDQEAYLYDTSDAPAFDPVYLGAQVTGVQFQSDADGNLVVVVQSQDGSINSYDSYGNNIGTQQLDSTLSLSAKGGDKASIPSAGKSLQKSPMFDSLNAGNISW
jgi:hypothetical protein